MPLSDIEVMRLWRRFQDAVSLSDFEITRLFDTLFERQGRFKFVAKVGRDYYNKEQELQRYVESWIKNVAYAENDFVVTDYNVKELLDKIHPQWRQVFYKNFPVYQEIDESKIIKDVMKDEKND